MKFSNLIFPAVVCLGLQAGAQTLYMNVTFPSEAKYEGMKVYVKPVNAQTQDDIAELQATPAGGLKGSVGVNPDGIYYIFCSTSSAQSSMPIYVPSGKTSESFEFSIGDDFTTSTTLNDGANRALEAYSKALTGKAIALGSRMDELTDAQVKEILASFMTDADSIVKSNTIPQQVEDFIRLWAYTSASDAYSLALYLASQKDRVIEFQLSDLLPEASTVLDTPMAASFPSSAQIIMSSLPKGTVEERLEALYSNYKTPEIRKNTTASLIDSFLTSFDYKNDFKSGEERLKAMTEKYGLPESYLDTFRARRATVTGAPFPEVSLVDMQGNPVDFSKFKGKYVYVDLWASWCGPCVREVPYLQQLEKDMEGSNVEFVSISIDSTKAPWLKKAEQLKLHGNQLWNSDENLPKRLNVRGIPHFMIYGPDGTLHTYKATRPSDPATKELLQSLK
ncbi:TlpA disulfide reductase family protein [uncultured Duncaniella sp.]|uniref:TlpA family protein disulfide reductase n=1 Tax=uncultured Duncaniella sp. TaxID=2768039 RepID=UPI0025FF73E1|nr:TlpA disulfide reductase family protein [uncultured Duncaniella sp.]